jgi:hypothetical protein
MGEPVSAGLVSRRLGVITTIFNPQPAQLFSSDNWRYIAVIHGKWRELGFSNNIKKLAISSGIFVEMPTRTRGQVGVWWQSWVLHPILLIKQCGPSIKLATAFDDSEPSHGARPGIIGQMSTNAPAQEFTFQSLHAQWSAFFLGMSTLPRPTQFNHVDSNSCCWWLLTSQNDASTFLLAALSAIITRQMLLRVWKSRKAHRPFNTSRPSATPAYHSNHFRWALLDHVF